MRTRDKIIQASIELFNLKGERQVTTNHIAAHLGISPGNLYYHFRNKNDIIRNIFNEYAKLLDKSFSPIDAEDNVIESLSQYFDTIFELMWKFSFLYANLPDILSRDEALQKRYMQVHATLIEKVRLLIQSLKDANVIDISDEDVPMFADSLKLQVMFWISYLRVQNASISIKKSEAYRGVVMVLLQFKPYVCEPATQAILDLQSHYQKQAAETNSDTCENAISECLQTEAEHPQSASNNG